MIFRDMIYSVIHHDIRNEAGLSMLDYCILDMIYALSSNGKEKYKTWCNASKKSFAHLAQPRNLVNRLNFLEKNGWIEFKDHKRLLKRTTPKYFNLVQSKIQNRKNCTYAKNAPMQKLHPEGENIAPEPMQKLHPEGENIAPNNNTYNNIDNNIDKCVNAQFDFLENQQNVSKEKSCAKKESQEIGVPKYDDGYQSSKKRLATKKGNSWSQLDVNLHSYKHNLPQQWSSMFTDVVIDYWYYLEEKKGVNWGTVRTIKAQVEAICKWLKKYTEQHVIDSIKECIERGSTQYNPQWTINRINNENDEQQKKINKNKKPSRFGKFGTG